MNFLLKDEDYRSNKSVMFTKSFYIFQLQKKISKIKFPVISEIDKFFNTYSSSSTNTTTTNSSSSNFQSPEKLTKMQTQKESPSKKPEVKIEVSNSNFIPAGKSTNFFLNHNNTNDFSVTPNTTKFSKLSNNPFITADHNRSTIYTPSSNRHTNNTHTVPQFTHHPTLTNNNKPPVKIDLLIQSKKRNSKLVENGDLLSSRMPTVRPNIENIFECINLSNINSNRERKESLMSSSLIR